MSTELQAVASMSQTDAESIIASFKGTPLETLDWQIGKNQYSGLSVKASHYSASLSANNLKQLAKSVGDRQLTLARSGANVRFEIF